jgi:8-oxo-dGTP diphosphatase
MSPPRVQRVAAYNVCVDESSRLLLCRLTAVTDRPGCWTLPGGGVEFGEHPVEAARRELAEESGLDGHVVELLAVDSAARVVTEGPDEREYHSIRIIYRTEIVGGALCFEADGSSDRAEWFTRDEALQLPLVALGRRGIDLAFGDGEPS